MGELVSQSSGLGRRYDANWEKPGQKAAEENGER